MRTQHGGLHFIGVADGFNDDAVGPGLRPQPSGLTVRGNGLLEGQFAIGGQQLARGAHVEGHPAVAGLLRGLLGQPHARTDDVFQLCAEAQGRCAEGVGGHDVAARIQISAMHRLDGFGMGQVPAFGHLAAAQSGGLQHGAHAAVQIDQTLSQRFL